MQIELLVITVDTGTNNLPAGSAIGEGVESHSVRGSACLGIRQAFQLSELGQPVGLSEPSFLNFKMGMMIFVL